MQRAIVILGIMSIGLEAGAQTALPDPLRYSVSTPRPINPAEGTTNPSARTTQSQNPYLGSVPTQSTGTTIRLSLQDALARGLRYNLGLVESQHASADVRADRLRALSALLPQISATARAAYESISYQEIGLKLPPIKPPDQELARIVTLFRELRDGKTLNGKTKLKTTSGSLSTAFHNSAQSRSVR